MQHKEIEAIILRANKFFGLDVRTKSRQVVIIEPRRMVIVLLRDHFGLTKEARTCC